MSATVLPFVSEPRLSFVNVVSYGAVGDGVTDDRAAIILALASAQTLGCRLHFPKPSVSYKLSKYLDIADAKNLHITGDNSVILYPSDDVTVVADAIAITDGRARSAFYIRRCRNVTVEGISFQGATSPSFDLVNLGIAIYQISQNSLDLLQDYPTFHRI